MIELTMNEMTVIQACLRRYRDNENVMKQILSEELESLVNIDSESKKESYDELLNIHYKTEKRIINNILEKIEF